MRVLIDDTADIGALSHDRATPFYIAASACVKEESEDGRAIMEMLLVEIDQRQANHGRNMRTLLVRREKSLDQWIRRYEADQDYTGQSVMRQLLNNTKNTQRHNDQRAVLH